MLATSARSTRVPLSRSLSTANASLSFVKPRYPAEAGSSSCVANARAIGGGAFRGRMPCACSALKATRRMFSVSHSAQNEQRLSGDKYVIPDANSNIFSSSRSAWEHVFKDIKEQPIAVPSYVRSPVRKTSNRLSGQGAQARFRRQTMTAREISAFDEMFNMIFQAVDEHKSTLDEDGAGPSGAGIGRTPSAGLGDLFSKLRRHSRKLTITDETDDELDRKREELEMCQTDQQLLEWAMREVFAESKKYEEAAQAAIDEADSMERDAKITMPPLQPGWYSELLALLIRTFRDKYRDPHLALSVFDHARHLSVPSYVLGCTTSAYNELIETRWRCFRDLRGVCDALEEMKVNGVVTNSKTRQIVERLRREVGERTMWEEESVLGSGDVLAMLEKAEVLSMKDTGPLKLRRTMGSNTAPPDDSHGQRDKSKRWTSDQEWKTRMMDDDGQDGWEFGKWER